MRLYWLKLIIILIVFCGPFNIRSARSLQIFNGTLTEIICSTDMPVFLLVTEEGVQHNVEHYTQLPGLFDIEAVVSPDENNVTLFINGTNRSNGVTVMCRNVLSSVSGRFETLFTLVLEFFSTLPAPDNVHYTRQGQTRWLQVMWQPPTLFTSQNISVDSRITHYIVSIISEDTANIGLFETPETSLRLELDNESCTFSFQVAAVNPAGTGEHSHPQIINWCTSSTTSTAVAKSSPASRTKTLSDSEIAAIAICVAVAIVVALSVAIAFICAKIKSDRSTQNLKSDLSHEVPNPKDILPEKEKEKDNNINMEDEHSSGGIHADDIVDEQEQEADSASTQRERCYSHDGPPDGLYYAEINVLTKKKNRVQPEPSSEDIDHHVYAVLEKPTKNDTDQNVEPDTDHPVADSQN